MKKILLIVLLAFSGLVFSQISVLMNLEKTNNAEYLIGVTIQNTSENTYIIPIDTSGLKMFFIDEACNNFYFDLLFPDLGLSTVITENNSIIEPDLKGGYMFNDGDYKAYKKSDKKEKKEIKKWRRENHINTFENAKINKYIIENLIILNPYQEYNFKINFDPYIIHYSEYKGYKYYFYPLEKGERYSISLQLCIEDNLYNFLTDKQKTELNKYILFKGNVESNKIEFTAPEYFPRWR